MGVALPRLIRILLIAFTLTVPRIVTAATCSSTFGQAGSVVDTDGTLCGALTPYANTTTSSTVNCSGGSISSSTINVASTSNFDSAGLGTVCDSSAHCNPFTYTGKTATSFTGVSDGTAGQIPTCSGNYASGSRVYAKDTANITDNRLNVLKSAIQNAQRYDGQVLTGAQLPAAGTLGAKAIVTGTDGLSCTSTGGSIVLKCIDNGVAWIPMLSVAALTTNRLTKVGTNALANSTLSDDGTLLTYGSLFSYNSVALVTPTTPTASVQGTPGSTSYDYRVVAYNAVGRSAGSGTRTVTTGNATLTGSNFIRLSGYTVTGATSYQIWRTATAGTPATVGIIGTTTSATFNDTGLAGDGAYGSVADPNIYSFPLFNTTVGLSLPGQLNVGSLWFLNNAGAQAPGITFELGTSGNPDVPAVVWLQRQGATAYQTAAYIDWQGVFATGASVVISNKRGNARGQIQGCGISNMFCVSPDVNGPAIGAESASSLAAGRTLQVAFAAFDLDDLSGGSTSWSVGYGKQKWAVLGDGSLLWGTYLDNTIIADNADNMFYRIGAGKMGLANSSTKSPTGELDLAKIGVGQATIATGSLLDVGSGGYAQFEKVFAGAPTAGDCDAAGEIGRVSIDTTNHKWYICEGAAGWKSVTVS